MADAGLGGFLTKRLKDKTIFEFDEVKPPPTQGSARLSHNGFVPNDFVKTIFFQIILPKNPSSKNGFVPNDFDLNDFDKFFFFQIILSSIIPS